MAASVACGHCLQTTVRLVVVAVTAAVAAVVARPPSATVELPVKGGVCRTPLKGLV